MSIQGSVSKKQSSESISGKGQLLILFLQVPEGKLKKNPVSVILGQVVKGCHPSVWIIENTDEKSEDLSSGPADLLPVVGPSPS